VEGPSVIALAGPNGAGKSTAGPSLVRNTTLASHKFAPWIDGLLRSGWRFELFFLWIPTPDLAVARVDARVQRGGHSVPADVIRRRYRAGLRSFFRLYRPLATSWSMYDNSGEIPRLIAQGSRSSVSGMADPEAWAGISAEYGNA
jgi:predicted ABC-type ATPase